MADSSNIFKSLKPNYKETYSVKEKGKKISKFKRLSKYLAAKLEKK